VCKVSYLSRRGCKNPLMTLSSRLGSNENRLRNTHIGRKRETVGQRMLHSLLQSRHSFRAANDPRNGDGAGDATATKTGLANRE
jgi:hypothetical protein